MHWHAHASNPLSMVPLWWPYNWLNTLKELAVIVLFLLFSAQGRNVLLDWIV